MKIILLFDSDKLDNCYREYELIKGADDGLRKGERVSITFCHPDHGEVFMVKSADPEEMKNND